MVKKYDQFLKETYSEAEHHTLGEYIENIAIGDEFVRMLVGQYTKGIDASINMANAINVLEDLTQVELLKRVENHLNDVQVESDVTEVDMLQESYGKGVLATFFKCLTALGFKDNQQQTSDVPSEFLILFRFSNVDPLKVQSVFKRFKSLSTLNIDYTKPNMGLYFGIRCTGEFEYGYYFDEFTPIGIFKMNKSTYTSLKLSEFKAASGLKYLFVNLSLQDILLMGRIKHEMENFNPGHFESKMCPIACLGGNKLISFGYYGVGRWENAQLNQEDIEHIKKKLRDFLSKFKWANSVQFSLSPEKFWVYIHIKLK